MDTCHRVRQKPLFSLQRHWSHLYQDSQRRVAARDGRMIADVTLEPLRHEPFRCPRRRRPGRPDGTRLAATRWPEQLPGTPWQRGVPVDYLRQLADLLGREFDWRAAGGRARTPTRSSAPRSTARRMHFLHVGVAGAERAAADPAARLAGFGGGVPRRIGAAEQSAARHGLDPAQAFHLVIPSLVGFGFSTPRCPGAGWTASRIAAAFTELMAGLGYAATACRAGTTAPSSAP